MKKHFLHILLLFGLVSVLQAQQIPLNNQYLINNFSLSPAFAGENGSFEVFMLYRNNWVGIPNSPRLKTLNFNGGITKNMGIGGTVSNEQAGIFNAISASLAYSYNVNLTNRQAIRFGLAGGFQENHIDLGRSRQQDLSDPVVSENQADSRIALDAMAGILYRFENLYLGASVPHLLETETQTEGGGVYTLRRQYTGHLSYTYIVNRLWAIEPFLIVRKTKSSPLLTEAAVLVKYAGQIWTGLTYRDNGTFGLSAGVLYKRLVLNYSYEFAGEGISGASSGSHEVSLGFLIGKNKNKPASIFSGDPKLAPYYNWIEK
jgi:type IX secretion system PorP/SprF family membrane protein